MITKRITHFTEQCQLIRHVAINAEHSDLLRQAVQAKQSLAQKWAHHRSGALKPKPKKHPRSVLLVLIAVLPGLIAGSYISKAGARILEENSLFVPSEDDDDDDY